MNNKMKLLLALAATGALVAVFTPVKSIGIVMVVFFLGAFSLWRVRYLNSLTLAQHKLESWLRRSDIKFVYAKTAYSTVFYVFESDLWQARMIATVISEVHDVNIKVKSGLWSARARSIG